MPQVPKKEFYCPCGYVSLSHMKKKNPLESQVLFFHFVMELRISKYRRLSQEMLAEPSVEHLNRKGNL